MLSVVIPTLNAAATLPRLFASLAEGRALIGDIVVSDGGSTDGTMEAARAHATVVTGARGRGEQLQVGAAKARGAWLLFLHVDTFLAPGWAATVHGLCVAEPEAERAAYFRFALDDDSPQARRLEALVAW